MEPHSQDRSQGVGAVPLLLMSAKNGDANNAPSCRSGAITLAESLGLYLEPSTSKIVGVAKGSTKKELHVLYRLQHAFYCHLIDAARLKHKGSDRMRDAIIAV